MHHRRVSLRLRQAVNLRACEHVAGVLEHAGTGHDVTGRYRDLEGVIAVLQVELALAKVRLGVPAPQIVVHTAARILLRDLVERTVASHAVATVLWDTKVPGDVEGGALAGGQGAGQVYLRDSAAHLQTVGHSAGVARNDLVEVIDDVPTLNPRAPNREPCA